MKDGDESAALEKLLVDVCFDRRDDLAHAGDLRGLLEARGIPPDDVAAILEAPPRIGVYRSLVRNGLAAVVSRLMPRTRARMNAACDHHFDHELARFLHERGPRTHYLRDVPAEFFTWVRPFWESDPRVAPYLVDLGAHELVCFELAAHDAPHTALPVADVDLTRPIVFSPSVKLVRYRWAVHQLPDDPDVRDEPAERSVALVGYRDDDHAVRWLELTPLAAAIVERLACGDPLGVGIARAFREQGAGAEVVDVARLLADLGERGIVLGGARGAP
jgi:uncharacterized protein